MLNFQIAVTVYVFITPLPVLLFCGLLLPPPLLIFLIAVLVSAVLLADIVLTIVSAIRVREGKTFRYPYIFRVIQ